MRSLGMVARPQSKRPSWASFVATTIAGLTVAFFVFVILAMGECLPRDGSGMMQVCDTTKQREFWLYPALAIALVVIAIWLQVNGRRSGRLIALGSGLAGAVVLWVAEMFIG
jgi:hypothetical protein